MNIASVSWGDHLTFGEGDGRLETLDAIARRIDAWRRELGAGTLHWRVLRPRVPGQFQVADGYEHASQRAAERVSFDEFREAPRLAHEAGVRSELYVSPFDEGWPLAPAEERASSHHNAMHGKEVAWQSQFSLDHPEYAEVDRQGRRQWGVLSLAHPEVRAHFVDRFTGWVAGSDFDGVFVCLRSQSRPADHADQYGFDPIVREAFQRRYGRDILRDDFDVQSWRDLRGEYLTRFLEELGTKLRPLGKTVSVGVARGDVIGPPLGNMTLDWRRWAGDRLIDALVINQSSSQCPSMWHQLWPMHRGTGYVQNHLTGQGLPPLVEHVSNTYAPAMRAAGVPLYVARQWDERDDRVESEIAEIPGVTGLVFSTFRHDNPAAVARGDWTI